MTRNKSSIRELAESIASEYHEKVTPLDKIVADEGLSVFYDSYGKKNFDGMTFYENREFYIHVNTDMANYPDSPRGRFTLAHELGHYYIDSHRIGLRKGLLEPHPSKTNQKQFNQIEHEADYFASCLLMPTGKFSNDLIGKKFNLELIDFLKDEYRVSRTACAFRFADIGNHPILIIYAEDGIIKWQHSSEDFMHKWLLFDKAVPPNSVMGEYFSGAKNNAFRKEEIFAVDIFKGVQDQDIDRKYYECCIPYKNKALSIIWSD